jgi:hypothetical protein
MLACIRFYACAAGLLALAALALPTAALAQQPTLRYSNQAVRSARATASDEEPQDQTPVGTGLRRVRQAAYDASTTAPGRLPAGYRPLYQRAAHQLEQPMAETIDTPPRGRSLIVQEPLDDMEMTMGGIHGDCSCGQAHLGHGHFGRMYHGDLACGACGPDCCLVPCPRPDNIELFVGAQGFTGPLNRGGSGSFGFHEGINGGMPFICGLALQAGYQATQNNFEGAFFTPDDRTQSFVTLGLFRRVDLGLQGGVVVDYLHDEWDYSVDLAQLRGELSWRMPCEHEFGFWFSAGLDRTTVPARVVEFDVPGEDDSTATAADGTLVIEPMDIYAFFYRKQLACGGEGRIFGGFTDDSRGLLGMNLRLPVNECLDLRTDFLYVVPREESALGFAEEAWNVSFSFAWRPFARRPCGPNYCRPLFDVANNGSFLTRIAEVVESAE